MAGQPDQAQADQQQDDPDHSDQELEQLRKTDELAAAQAAEHLERVPDDETPPAGRVRD